MMSEQKIKDWIKALDSDNHYKGTKNNNPCGCWVCVKIMTLLQVLNCELYEIKKRVIRIG